MDKLKLYDDTPVRIFTASGDVYEGDVLYHSPEYSLQEYGRPEAALQLDERLFFAADIASVEALEEGRDPVSFHIVPERDFRTTAWSGGVTTQFLICPREAEYDDRDFLWRVSSATVEAGESDFTALPDYYRFITTLSGEMVLSHNAGPEIHLPPFKIHCFDGIDTTRSRGRCTDFNLMLRKGKAQGRLELLELGETPRLMPPETTAEDTLFYCAKGEAVLTASIGPHTVRFTIREGDVFLIEGVNPQPFTLEAVTPARLIMARVGRI